MRTCGRCTNCQSDATELDFAPGYPFGLLIFISVVCFGLALVGLIVMLKPDIIDAYNPTGVRSGALRFTALLGFAPFLAAHKTHVRCTKCGARWRR